MVKYKIEIKQSAIKELNNLPKNVLSKIVDKIHFLADNPRPIDCIKLRGKEQYRIRQGKYRILYSIQNEVLVVFIVKIAHRKDMYK